MAIVCPIDLDTLWRSPVNVAKDCTGIASRSGGTATKCSADTRKLGAWSARVAAHVFLRVGRPHLSTSKGG